MLGGETIELQFKSSFTATMCDLNFSKYLHVDKNLRYVRKGRGSGLDHLLRKRNVGCSNPNRDIPSKSLKQLHCQTLSLDVSVTGPRR